MERGAKPAKTKVEARPPAPRKSRKIDGSTGLQLEQRLTEALEQQAATSEILHAISSSPTDLDPVFRMILANATRLCGASVATLWLFDGELLRSVAHQNASPEFAEYLARARIRPSRETTTRRAALERKTIHVADLLSDPDYSPPEFQRKEKVKTVLSVPLLRQDTLVGVVTLWRREVRPFTDRQVALVETFADQAVIAIENVRLFKELESRNRHLTEALEQQTATSDILRVISQSPTDVQPVFDTIVAAALKLCGAGAANVFTFDGELIHLAAFVNVNPQYIEAMRQFYPRPPSRDTGVTRAIQTCSVVAIPDVVADREYSHAIGAHSLAGAFRSVLAVPLVRDGKPIGAIAVGRAESGLFPDTQVELLKTFADQAVIAIENVRLFKELETRNRDLTEALEQQTATSDILRVISQSPTDVQPVFDTIAAAALKLCRASSANVFRIDGELICLAALVNVTPEGADAIRRAYPRPLGSRDIAASRAVLTRSVAMIPDVREDLEFGLRDTALAAGFRSILAVPLMREGSPIGAIAVGRPEPGPFPDTQVELLKTFADQAVIAIENVRLFKELEARNRDLTEALEQQTATSEILRVISQSQTNIQPVFDAIVRSAVRLCSADHSIAARFDGELLHPLAHHGFSPEALKIVERMFPMRPGPENMLGRAALSKAIVNLPDMLADPMYSRDFAMAGGWRSGLGVPMLRDGELIGAIAVSRTESGAFPDHLVALLTTFADQAVIAIENARLFKELETRNRDLTEALEQQTATSDILRVISRSQTDVQPVFDTIASAALKLCGASSVNVFTFDGELIHLAAFVNVNPDFAAVVRQVFPRPPGRDTAVGRAILARNIAAIPDVLEDREFAIGPQSLAGGFRSALSVPLIRDGSPIGAISVGRPEPGPFPDKQIALLETFADQAVIAIENVRLFNETKEALERQTATAEILRVISASPTDVVPVFETILENACRLCGSQLAAAFRFDGTLLHLVATKNWPAEALATVATQWPAPPDQRFTSGQVILTRAIVVQEDTLADPAYDHSAAQAGGWRRMLGVPMLREGEPIGAIIVTWREPGRIPERQVELLKSFADQAVIAIENVRLFKELKARTTELTQSVGELRALGEVGQAVSSTLDLGTVLRTIVSRATQLAGMDGGAIYEYDETREEFYLHTADRLPDELVEALRATPIRKGEGALGQMAVTGEPVQIRDIMDEGIYQSRVREILIRLGYRSLLAVPLLREDHLLGGLAVNRTNTGEFEPQVIDLLKTFATQSALAIQNARLFREIEVKSRELETASRHKSEFLANMSHELRTPLNAIIGFSEVLSERMFGEINDKQAEYLTDILESGRHLLSLINDILDLSKIEAGRMELEPTDFDLPAAIENTLILVRERAQRRGITLGRTVDERLGMIRADERKLKQVLLNLLSNALKFTPEGGQIDVRARAHNGEAEISVADTGVGIAPEDQEAVFEEFRQVGTTARKVEGTGLGLAISRKFIELHGGRIWVKSQVGMGSTFAFTLPLTIDQRHPTGS